MREGGDFGVDGAVAAQEREQGLGCGVGEFFAHGCGGWVCAVLVVVVVVVVVGCVAGDRGRSRVGVIAGAVCEGACVYVLVVMVVVVMVSAMPLCNDHLVVAATIVLSSSIVDVDIAVVVSLSCLHSTRKWRMCGVA